MKPYSAVTAGVLLLLNMPETDIVTEAQRILNRAQSTRTEIRLIGGLAFRLRNPSSLRENLQRKYVDIDFVGFRNQRREIEKLFTDLGYTPRDRFNKLNAFSRLIFNDIQNGRRVDIFLNTFEMSHKLDFTDRIKVDKMTLPLADLLLTKLQVYEITEREYRDVMTLLLDHELGDTDQNDKINAKYIASLASRDWGLYRTIALNLQRIESAIGSYSLSEADKAIVQSKIAELRKRIEEAPKSLSWKMRARVGEKVRWYELPEGDVEVVDSRMGGPHEKIASESKSS